MRSATRWCSPSSGSCSAADPMWRQLFDDACQSLAEAGSNTPQIDARRMMETAAALRPGEFHDVLGRPAPAWAAAHFHVMMTRRCAGEPLQYAVGSWGFRSLDLLVDHRVLIPRPETETTAGWAIVEARRRESEGRVAVADLGTGSGAIALSVAVECPRARVFATDVSPDALAVARANLAGLGRAATRVTLHSGDWFDALDPELQGAFDVIVSNPPYVGCDERLPPEVGDWEPPLALRAGPEGTEHVAHLISEAPAWLRRGGALVVEMAPHQSAAVLRQARRRGFEARVERDLAGRDRVLVARLR